MSFIALFLANCEETEDPPVKRTEPKIQDPKKQVECAKAGSSPCDGDKSCEDICEDIFPISNHKKACYKFPKELVLKFEKVISAIEEGEAQDIDQTALNCLLDLDEREAAKAAKEMSRSEAKKFLADIVKDHNLAKIFKEEDDESNILKQIFSKISSGGGLRKVLATNIEDKTVLWLMAENNKEAYIWMDNYVKDICRSSDDDCPGEENIGAYCKALIELDEDELEDFLSDADIFESEYKSDLKSDNYEYTESDFREYCEWKSSSTPDTRPPTTTDITITYSTPIFLDDCPETIDNPRRDRNKLALITFQDGEYSTSGNIIYEGDTYPMTVTGSSHPYQDIILSWKKREPPLTGVSMVLNNDRILEDLNEDALNRPYYYVYMNGKPFQITRSSGSRIFHYKEDDSASSVNVLSFSPFFIGQNQEVPTDFSETVVIHLAKEENGDCTYFTP